MGKAVNSSRSRPCSLAAADPQAPTPARGAAARGSATAQAALPVPSWESWVLMRERLLRLQRKLCHLALLTAAAPVGTAQLCNGAAGGSTAAWDWHSSRVPHILLGTCKASPSSQTLSPMCGCIPGDSQGAAPWFVSGRQSCPMVATEMPAQCKGKALLHPCLRLAGWAEAGGERAQCWGRTGCGSARGCGSSQLQPFHVSCNFTCSCPQAAGDKHRATVLCVGCDLSSARVCLALRISRE